MGNDVLELGLTEIWALVGFVSVVGFWRLAAFPGVMRRLAALRVETTARAATNDIALEYWGRRLQRACQIVGFAFMIGSILGALDYSDTARDLIGNRALDFSVASALSRHAESARRFALIATACALALFLFDWGSGLALRERSTTSIAWPAVEHAFRVPGEWAEAEAAMWQARLQWANSQNAELPSLESLFRGDHWRRDWPTWAKVVTLYQGAAAGWRADNKRNTAPNEADESIDGEE